MCFIRSLIIFFMRLIPVLNLILVTGSFTWLNRILVIVYLLDIDEFDVYVDRVVQ